MSMCFYDPSMDPPIYPNKPEENILICHTEGYVYYINPRTFKEMPFNPIKMELEIMFNTDLILKQYKQDKMVRKDGGIGAIASWYTEPINPNSKDYGGYLNVIYSEENISRLNPRYHRLTQDKAIRKMIKNAYSIIRH